MEMAAFRLAFAAALVCCLLPSSRCALSLASTAMSASPSPSSTASAMTTTATTETISPSPVPSPSTTVTSPTSPVVSPTKTSSPVVSPTKTTSHSSTATPTSSTKYPGPSPAPTNFFSYWNRATGHVCVNVTGSAVLQFTYLNKEKKRMTVNLFATDRKDWNATVDEDNSNCTSDEVKLSIVFGKDPGYNHTLFFQFIKIREKEEYELSKIGATLELNDTDLFTGLDSPYDIANGTTNEKNGIFTTSSNRSYSCKTVRKFTMTLANKTTGESLALRLSHFSAQAFNFTNETQGFIDKGSHCSLDQKTSKVVPIAVGAALAGLVVVVLIAYLIGRFRSRKQNSYEALS